MTTDPDSDVPRRRGKGRLRRQPGGRPHVVQVKLSDTEKLVIAARAARLGVSEQRLMVEAAMEGSASTVTDRHALLAELLGIRRLVGNLGNNVNQIAKVANATGTVPAEVRAVAAAVSRALVRLDAKVAELPGGRR